MYILSTIKNKFIKFQKSISEENLFENYLPIFRVYLSFHIIKKIFLNWSSTDLFFNEAVFQSKFFDISSFIYSQVFNGVPLINVITLILAIFYAFGIGKYLTAVLLFFSYLIYFEPFLDVGNGGDNLLYFILIYMSFANSYKYFTLKNTYKLNFFSNTISNLASLSIMFHLCLIYFVSGVHKLNSDVWFNGVATYYIWQLERFNAPINDLFYKNSFIIAMSTYVTILFEILFPFLIWFKKVRPLFLILGILLHLGIYFTMMIYDFEILFIFIYGFWISNQDWEIIFNRLKKYKIFSNYYEKNFTR